MLVLKRGISESTYIIVPPSDKPTTIEVIVIDIHKEGDGGGIKMRLGFAAPSAVVIHRKEVLEEIARGESKASFPTQRYAAEIVAKAVPVKDKEPKP